MKPDLPNAITQKILEMPEYSQGVNKVRVRLQDGRTFSGVFVAWGNEIVKVAGYINLPFDPSDVVEVENDL